MEEKPEQSSTLQTRSSSQALRRRVKPLPRYGSIVALIQAAKDRGRGGVAAKERKGRKEM